MDSNMKRDKIRDIARRILSARTDDEFNKACRAIETLIASESKPDERFMYTIGMAD